MTSQDVVSNLYDAVDRTQRFDEQRFRQWTDILGCRPDAEVFDALYSVFTNPDRDRTRYLDQEYAGRLLFAVAPDCSVDPGSTIRKVLAMWDLSIEQLPWYFEEVLGTEALRAIFAEIDTMALSEMERRALETMRYWLRATNRR